MPKRRPDPEEKKQEMIRQLELADQGDAASQNAVAARLAQGYFVKSDLSGALYWYLQAAKQGYTHAKWNAGSMLIAGEGVTGPRMELGIKLIEDAAESGEPSACNFLAYCYAEGAFGKVKDTETSARWSARARDYESFVEHGEPIDATDYGMELCKPVIEWTASDK